MMTDRELKNALMTFIFGLVSGLCIATLIIGIVNQPKSDLFFQDTEVEAIPSCRVHSRSLGVFEVTAYCPCEKCCGQYADGITASGHKIEPGDVFVAAPKRIPFETLLIIPGYANSLPVRVLDRGGAITKNCLDVFFPTHQEALVWGRQKLEIFERTEK